MQDHSLVESSDFFPLAQGGSPHGIDGGVYFKFYNLESHAISVGQEILVKCLLGEFVRLKLRAKKMKSKGEWIFFFEGLSTPEAVKELKIVEMGIAQKDLPPLRHNEVYLSLLAGMKVVESEESSVEENVWGEVKNTFEVKGMTILEIEDTQTGEMISLPWVDAWVKKIEREKNRMIIPKPTFY